ncbi:MAG: hypothetical protein DRN14_04985 [Thermoplasmata archaeon]|nr:MAG: hypothetical protein DRN14_04985 [Thermoplasmata archaeon]
MLPDGSLSAGPTAVPAPVESFSFAWEMVPDGADGVYVATGSGGLVGHVDAAGRWDVVARTTEYEVFALSIGKTGTLYFAGAPNATIYRRKPGAEAEVVVDLPESAVWAVAELPGGDIVASAGEEGRLYRIRADGKTEVLATVPDTKVTVIRRKDSHHLYLATEPKALLLELDLRSGQLSAVFDAADGEIVGLVPFGEEGLAFAWLGAEGVGVSGPGEAPEVREAQSKIYLLRGDGLVEEITPPNLRRAVFCMAEAPDGDLLLGAGRGAELLLLEHRGGLTRVLSLPEDQVLSLATSGRKSFVGTGGGGSVYVIDWGADRVGTYTSEVLDAGTPSVFGSPRWVAFGEGSLEIETRSGAASDPDESWSEWKPLKAGRVASPPARFLQWRATLKSPGNAEFTLRLQRLVVPFRPPNSRPRVWDVVVTRGGSSLRSDGQPREVSQDLPGGISVRYSIDRSNNDKGSLKRAGLWARTMRTATWRADDPDGDRMIYRVLTRKLRDGSFVEVCRDLETPAFTWDAAAWPDGWYEIKVVASDERSNPPGEGLEGEAVGGPFLVDNTPPRFLHLEIRLEGDSLFVAGTVEDESTPIRYLEYSPDGAGWFPVLPSDGILDTRRERFDFPIPPDPEGHLPAVVGVRAADEIGNAVVGQLERPGR